jgi:hypothetical protein
MLRARPLVSVVLLCAVTAGCSGSDVPPMSAAGTSAASATGTTPPTQTPTPTETGTPEPSPTQSPIKNVPRTFDPKNFGNTLTNVNPYVPLVPGLQAVMKGYVTVGGRRLPHVRVTTVVDVSKKIDGVRAILVLDQDIDGGQLSEQAVDYLAEDAGGNVWYVGSYTESYETGQFQYALDAWLAGVGGAEPGLFFPGEPKAGAPAYYQTQVPGVETTTAQVAKVGEKRCVPFKCYSDVAVILEAGSENKFWAPGVGQILTEPLSGSAQETEELVNLRQLTSKSLAELSAEALRLDRDATRYAPTVFGGSNPAERGV